MTLLLPGGRANLGFVRLLVEEQRDGQQLGLQDLLLLNHLWTERTTTSAAAAKIIQQSQTEARRYLSRLVEHRLVESRGRGRGASYQLSSATYRRLGLEQKYVRQRGFEPLQQDQLVLQYVAARGRIARRDAAELCKVHPKQASRILATDPSRRPGHARQEERRVVRAAGRRQPEVVTLAP